MLKYLYLPLLCLFFSHPGIAQQADTLAHTRAADTIPIKVKQLKEVSIKATKPLTRQNQYGTVVNVESSILSKGSNVLTLLERSPGVMIDRRNNNIQLNGKTGVKVMINGKLMQLSTDQLISLLNGMSAADIEKIELLSTPPAKYDAQGNAGLINIVLKKNKSLGTNASIYGMAGFGRGEKANIGFNLAHNTSKLGWYGNYNFWHERSYSWFQGKGDEIMPQFGYTIFDFKSINKPTANGHNVSLGIDANLNSHITTGASVNYFHSSNTGPAWNTGNYTIGRDSVLALKAFVSSTSQWNNIDASAYLENKISEGEQYNINADLMYYKNAQPLDVTSSFLNNKGEPAGDGNQYAARQKGITGTVIRVGVLKTDYEKQLNKKIRLQAGIKGSYADNTNTSGIQSLVDGEWVARGGASGVKMNESIGAAYLSGDAQLDSATSLTLGVRYEYANTQINDPQTPKNSLQRTFSSWFPSAFFTHKFSENTGMQLSFTRRINRPSYNDLFAFLQYNDPLSVFTGNPSLKPTITSNFKVGYNLRNFAFSLTYSHDDHPIVGGQLMTGPELGVVYIMPENLTWQNSLQAQANLPLKVSSWWNMNYNFIAGWYKYKFDYLATPTQKAWWGFSINATETFILPKAYSLELSGYYNGDSYGGNSHNYPYSAVSAGIKKELPKDKGTFQFTVDNPIQIRHWTGHIGIVGTDAFLTNAIIDGYSEANITPIYKLTYRRPIGNPNAKSRKRNSTTTDESERVRKN